MGSMRAALLRFRSLFEKERLDRDLDDELANHLEMHIIDNLQTGMSPGEARRNALLKLGGLQQTKEGYRDRRGLPFFESVWQDLRFALRTLRKSPGFTAVAILTLALGIGANTAIFSVFYGVLLRPLPYPKSEQIVRLWEVNENGGHPNFSDPNFEDLQAQSRSFQALAEYYLVPQTVSFGQSSARVGVSAVSRDFFRVIGVQPFEGRGFIREEQQFNAGLVALASYAYWKQTLGGQPDRPFLASPENQRAASFRRGNHASRFSLPRKRRCLGAARGLRTLSFPDRAQRRARNLCPCLTVRTLLFRL